jgi:hypothetical protein
MSFKRCLTFVAVLLVLALPVVTGGALSTSTAYARVCAPETAEEHTAIGIECVDEVTEPEMGKPQPIPGQPEESEAIRKFCSLHPTSPICKK